MGSNCCRPSDYYEPPVIDFKGESHYAEFEEGSSTSSSFLFSFLLLFLASLLLLFLMSYRLCFLCMVRGVHVEEMSFVVFQRSTMTLKAVRGTRKRPSMESYGASLPCASGILLLLFPHFFLFSHFLFGDRWCAGAAIFKCKTPCPMLPGLSRYLLSLLLLFSAFSL